LAKPIHVRFSGFIVFLGNIASLLTGMVFTVLISRNLSVNDFGTWFFLGTTISYFQILENIFTYWASRDIPRGLKVGKTCIFVNFIISLPLTLMFIIVSYFLIPLFHYPRDIFLVGSVFMPIYYVSYAIVSIIASTEPHKLGLKDVIIDGTKIILAIVMLRYGLIGIIISVAIANIFFILYGLSVSRKNFENIIDIQWIKDRTRFLWLPLHSSAIGYLSAATDSFIVGVLSGTLAISYYGIALTLGRTMKYASSLASSIYPKLLSKGDITLSEARALFKFLYTFSIPLLIGGLILSKALVSIFGSKYLEAATLLYLLFPAFFLGSISSALHYIITGVEKVDAKAEVKFKELLRSRLFTTQLINYMSISILVVGSILLTHYIDVFGPALSRLLASILVLAFYCILGRKTLKLNCIFAGLDKILPSTLPMIIFLYLYRPIGFANTMIAIIIGALIYFTTLIMIDRESRRLLKAFIKELLDRLTYY